MDDNYPMFSWMENPDHADGAMLACVSIRPAKHGYWEITVENADGRMRDTTLDDDAASAWSEVARIMCEHCATHDETAGMVNAAPANLGWCFDGQVGMYAYDKNEEWDG